MPSISVRLLNLSQDAYDCFMKALQLEAAMVPEPSHAATMISACSALGALGRHEDALAMAGSLHRSQI
jgi:hypothetical protein